MIEAQLVRKALIQFDQKNTKQLLRAQGCLTF